MSPGDQFFGFFPALPLENNLELGEWMVGSPPKNVAWASLEFQQRAGALFDSFAPPFRDGARLWHRTRGFDGSGLDPGEFRAIQTTVTFVALEVTFSNVATPDQVSDDSTSVWGVAGGSKWAVGESGWIDQTDAGGVWQNAFPSGSHRLGKVRGFDAGGVWAAGDTLLHWDGH